MPCQAEERRQRALQPYLVAAPARGVIGNSKYAERLRKGVLAAARDPKRGPVMLFGEPGLGKANLAALVHFGSPTRNRPMVQVRGGRVGSAPCLFVLLSWVCRSAS